MHRTLIATLSIMAAVAASPALAQTADAPAPDSSGAYGVVRAGAAVDSDFKFKDRDAAAPRNVRKDEDFKAGFNGELGIGYAAGPARIEGTVGYTRVSIDGDRTGGANGRSKQLNLGLSAYVDIPSGSMITPYVGGGVGASRVEANYARVGGTPVSGSRFSGRDWGFQWHFDAGLGVQVAQKTSVELGARYTRTSALEYHGFSGPVGTGAIVDSFKPRLASLSVLAGIRQKF